MIEFDADYLLKVRRKALRSKLWFKILNSAERAILTLAPKCVDRIKSPKLTLALAKIIVKINQALRSPLSLFRSQVARPIAEKISLIAQRWGNKSAREWAEDPKFITYIAVIKFNDNPVFR